MTHPAQRAEPEAAQRTDRSAVRAGLGFTLFSNADLAIVLTMLPIAMLHGQRLLPLVVSVVLSIQVFSALAGSALTPLVLGRLRPSYAMAVSSALKAAGIAVLASGSALAQLYVFAVLGGLGLGVSRPVVRLLLNGAVPPGKRSHVFQVFFVMVNLAHVIAPVVAELARDRAVTVLVLLVVVEVMVGAAVAVTGRGVPAEPRRSRAHQRSWALLRQPLVLAIVGYTFVAYFAMGFVMTMFQLYESVTPELGGYRPFFLSFEPLVLIGMQLVLMRYIHKLGHRSLYLAAAVTGGVGMVLAFTSSFTAVLIGLVLFALSECLALPRIQVAAGEAAPPGQAGAVFALTTVCTAIGEISGTLIAGTVARAEGDGLLTGAAAQGRIVGVVVMVAMLLGGLVLVRARPADPA